MTTAVSLHLRPLSRADQRVWCVDGGAGPEFLPADRSPPERPRRGLLLSVVPDCHETFASFRRAVEQLAALAGDTSRSDVLQLVSLIEEAGCGAQTDRAACQARLLADSVTFAVTRRISRESVYTARLIEAGARFLNRELARLLPGGYVHVPHVDRLDRGTLKVLARAALLLQRSDGFTWVWHSATDPAAAVAAGRDHLYTASRSTLLRQLAGIVQPHLRRDRPGSSLSYPERFASVSLDEACVALVLQNYDACFLFAEQLTTRAAMADAVEALRIEALAAVNVGRIPDALAILGTAERHAGAPTTRAHIAYLRGLTESKRRYDLTESERHYQRGLAVLDAGPVGDGHDGDLERAWLLNGQALNAAITWRRDQATVDHHDRAFRLIQEAFRLVRDGRAPQRIYLRSNLLANSALLLEMRGSHDAAIQLFESVFPNPAANSSANLDRWLVTTGYRLGVLHYRAGRPEVAYGMLRDASAREEAPENWPIRERVLRALGTAALELGDWTAASAAFEQGLRLAREARAAEGTTEHGRGLVAALVRDGQRSRAADVVSMLRCEDDVDVMSQMASLDAVVPSPPSPKLPAYIAEIDLEGIPPIDLNRFLADAPLQGAVGSVSWTS